MLCARNEAALLQVQKELLAIAGNRSKVLIKPTDVSKLAEVEALVAATLKETGRLDILVANAGVYGTKGPIEEIDLGRMVRCHRH